MAPLNTMHQRISSILSRKIGNYIESNKGKCEVFAAPFAVYLDEKTNTYVEPDVSVICDPDKLVEQGMQGCSGLDHRDRFSGEQAYGLLYQAV